MGTDFTVTWVFFIERTKKRMNHTYRSGVFSYFHSDVLRHRFCSGIRARKSLVVHPGHIQAGRPDTADSKSALLVTSSLIKLLTSVPWKHLLFCCLTACSPGSRSLPDIWGVATKETASLGLKEHRQWPEVRAAWVTRHGRFGCKGTLCAFTARQLPA